MPTLPGSLRQWALSPSLRRVSRPGRGFPRTPSPARSQLEAVPQAVVCGFEWAMASADPWELERRLGLVEPALRGFAYEGATMALTVLDAVGGGGRTRRLLTGHGSRHLLLAYIGVGFAMSRLPRTLWRRAMPDLPESRYHPTMSWLAVDGYGFDLAYFDVDRWVVRQRRPTPYPWLGRPDYFPRAVDQGIGRALWFVHGARSTEVAAAVDRFPPGRRADLWSGVGLAATFAGGCDPDALAWLADRAGEHRAQLAVGAVFTAAARTRAGHVPDATTALVRALCGLDVAAAARLADETAPEPGGADGDQPAYEAWRERIRCELRRPSGRDAPSDRDPAGRDALGRRVQRVAQTETPTAHRHDAGGLRPAAGKDPS